MTDGMLTKNHAIPTRQASQIGVIPLQTVKTLSMTSRTLD